MPFLRDSSRAAAQRDLLRAGDGFPLDDAVVARCLAAGLVAEDEEEGHFLRGDPRVDAGLDDRHAGDRLDATRILFVQAGEEGIERVGLDHQQVIVDRDAGRIVYRHAPGHGAQRDDGGHANGDAQDG